MKTKPNGPGLLNNSRLNKGTAFTETERDAFALHGLLPPHVGNLEEQRTRRHNWLAGLTAPIAFAGVQSKAPSGLIPAPGISVTSQRTSVNF